MFLRKFSMLVRSCKRLAQVNATDGPIPLAFRSISEMLRTEANGLLRKPSKEHLMEMLPPQIVQSESAPQKRTAQLIPPLESKLSDDELAAAYIATATQLNIQMAKELGWNMSDGMPTYTLKCEGASRRMQAINDKYGRIDCAPSA